MHVDHVLAAVGILDYARRFKTKPNLCHCSHVILLSTKHISIQRTVSYAESRNSVLWLDLFQGHRPRKRWWDRRWSYCAALTRLYFPPERSALWKRILQSLNRSLTRKKIGRHNRTFAVLVAYIVTELTEEFPIFHKFFNYSITPIIQTLVIRTANYPDRLGPSDNFVENSRKLISLEITGYRIEYSIVKCYGCLELQIKRDRKV
jgi:hypothetical protein